jgi:hypothetical protein
MTQWSKAGDWLFEKYGKEMKPYQVKYNVHTSNIKKNDENGPHLTYWYKVVNKNGEYIERTNNLR